MNSPNSVSNLSREDQAFRASNRPHILMLTTHGVHEWKVIPGLPDTGGQNIFVNHFADALTKQGCRVTIANRGGYPHPRTQEPQTGLHYKNENLRLFYLEDKHGQFVRKEDMGEQIPELVRSLESFLVEDGTKVDLIISHYWDAALVGEGFRRVRDESIPHIWVPHSLGAIKKRNVSSDEWESLRINERIATEKELVLTLDGIAATSPIIRDSLEDDYAYLGPTYFLPPCVDPERFHPRDVRDDHDVWEFLSDHAGISAQAVRDSRIITEISRTDRTKRKDVLIRAFARVQQDVPRSFLVVSIDDSNQELAGELYDLLDELGVRERTATLGSVWDILPTLYAISYVYCTPSVMEGFGMAVQEAAATGVPAVASHLVPFATEYLLGEAETDPSRDGLTQASVMGEGAIVVQADDVNGFASALKTLLEDDQLRDKMGASAYKITIPYFTWERRTQIFLDETKALDSGIV